MALNPALLEILACPECKTGVTPTSDGQALVCSTCRRRYPVIDDIPVLLVEEATLSGEDPP